MESANINQEIKIYPTQHFMNNEEYNMFVIKTNKSILIKYLFYETELDLNDLALLTNKKYKTIGEYFAYFDSIFLKNNFDLDYNKLIIKNNDYQKKVEIPLFTRKDNNDCTIEKIYDKNRDLEYKINELKRENEQLRIQIKNIKSDFVNLRTEHRIEIEILKMQIKSLFQQQMNPMMNNFGCFNNLNNQNSIIICFALENTKKIFVKSFYNDTFSLLISKFYLEYSKEKRKKRLKFLFNGRALSPDSNDTLANLGIYDLSMILVLETNYPNSDESVESVTFRHSGKGLDSHPVTISFNPNEFVSDLIERFRNFSGNKSKNIIFIFNGISINQKLLQTCEELGLTNNAHIFVLRSFIDIIFKISYIGELFCPLNIEIIPKNYSVTKPIELYLKKSNINRKDIDYFISNNQKLEENLTIDELNLEDKSEILVISKKRFYTIFINFRIYNKESNINRIECLKSYLISTLIEQFNKTTKLNLDEEYFIYNGKELNKNMSVEEAGLKNNDIVYIKKFKFIKNK